MQMGMLLGVGAAGGAFIKGTRTESRSSPSESVFDSNTVAEVLDYPTREPASAGKEADREIAPRASSPGGLAAWALEASRAAVLLLDATKPGLPVLQVGAGWKRLT